MWVHVSVRQNDEEMGKIGRIHKHRSPKKKKIEYKLYCCYNDIPVGGTPAINNLTISCHMVLIVFGINDY